MADVTVTVDQQALTAMIRDRGGEIAIDLAQRAIRVDRAAKRYCPVDTGRLRASISWQVMIDSAGLFAIIGSDVEYAAYIELGTRYMQAQPYLRPALAEAA